MANKREVTRLRGLLEERDEELQLLKQRRHGGAAASVVFRERSTKTFSGRPTKSEHLSVEDWIEEINRATRHRSEMDKLDYTLEHLRGEALEEVKHRDRRCVATCEHIFDILKKAFGDSNWSKAHMERQFYNRKQLRGENLRQYSHGLMALVSKLTDHDEEERDQMLSEQFAENVRSAALKRELKQLCRREKEITFIHLRDEAISWAGEDEFDSEEEDEPVRRVQQVTTTDCLERMQELMTQNLKLTETLVHQVQGGSTPDPGASTGPQRYAPAVVQPGPQMYSMPPPVVPPTIPSWFQKPRYSEDGRPICFTCEQVGHIAKYCRAASQRAQGPTGRPDFPQNPPPNRWNHPGSAYFPQQRLPLPNLQQSPASWQPQHYTYSPRPSAPSGPPPQQRPQHQPQIQQQQPGNYQPPQ